MNGNTINVNVPNEDIASKIVVHLKNQLLDKKLSSLKLMLPTKIFLVEAVDAENLSFKAEQYN